MIDDSFVWGLCGFTIWRCMTGAYLGVYSMHESSGSMSHVCSVLDPYIVIIHEIKYFWFVKIWLAYPLFLVVLCLIFLSVMIVSWHGSRWCWRWIFGRSSRL